MSMSKASASVSASNSNKSYFAFGDIHGSALELKALLSELPIKAGDELIFLGDYIDRGPHSKEVIDIILDLKKKYPENKIVTLKGNHEKMFLDFLKDSKTPEAQSFIFNGGGATLSSYSKKDNSKDDGEYIIPKNHIQFLENLELYYETEKYLFVHAGLPNVPIKSLPEFSNKELEQDLLWMRDTFFESQFNWEKTIVHGHTTVQDVEIAKRRINIDTGCAYGGKLTVLELPQMRIYSVPKQEPLKTVVMMDGKKRKSVRYKGNIPLRVYHNNQVMNFVSVDYNEFGMLIHDLNEKGPQLFQVGQKIKGMILPEEIRRGIHFEAEIIRYYGKSIGHLYAIKFTNHPFEQIR